MLQDGLNFIDDSVALNFQIQNGVSLPVSENNIGELFYLTAGSPGLYVFNGSTWAASAGTGGAGDASVLTGTSLATNVVSSSLTSTSSTSFTIGIAAYNNPVSLSPPTTPDNNANNFTIRAGNSSSTYGDGGNMTVAGGSTPHAGWSSGTLTLRGGDAEIGNSNGGAVTLRGGAASGAGNGGNVSIDAGTSPVGVDGYVSISTDGTQRLRFLSNGAWSIGSAGTNYGMSGQVLTSNGNAAPTWQAVSSGIPSTLANTVIFGTVPNSPLTITGITATAVSDHGMTIKPGFQSATNTAGAALNLLGGGGSNGGSPGGAVNIIGGTSTQGYGGNINISPGDGTASGTGAGDLYLKGGLGAGAGPGGEIIIYTAPTIGYFERLRIARTGAVLFGGTGSTASGHGAAGQVLTSNGNASPIWTETAGSTPPASTSSSGRAGEVRYDSNFVYVCVATNTWRRSALSTW